MTAFVVRPAEALSARIIQKEKLAAEAAKKGGKFLRAAAGAPHPPNPNSNDINKNINKIKTMARETYFSTDNNLGKNLNKVF